MPEVECQDSGEPAEGRVCRHLFETLDGSTFSEHYRRFTGDGADYLLLCAECGQSEDEVPLHWVCSSCLRDVAFGERLGEQGRPEIRERDIGFAVENISLGLTQDKILQTAALNSSEWLAITERGVLVRINSEQGSVRREFSLRQVGLSVRRGLFGIARPATWSPSYLLLAAEPLVLIAAAHDTYGVVVDLRTGQVTMKLRRGNYRVEHCRFPVAFFESGGRLLLVHGTDWNRVDVSDPFTGKCLTPRESPVSREGKKALEHYLDYFHGELQVSPGGDWIASNGWAWHPCGIVRSWNVKRWLSTNFWESEDGESVRGLCNRDYFWDGPVCWVGHSTLAVWGLGDDDNVMVPGVRIFDVSSGEELRSFTGPQISGKSGTFLFDRFLFSYGADCELGVWDIATGERVFRSDSFAPLAYNRQNRAFLHQDQAGRLHLARISCPNWSVVDCL